MMTRPIHHRGWFQPHAAGQGPGGRLPVVNALALVLLALTLLAGCNHETEPPTTASRPFAVEKHYSRGPVEMIVRLSRKEMTIAERLTLQLSVRAQEDYTVTLPAFGEKLEQFGIADYQAGPPELLDADTLLYQQTYTLEPFLSGDYTIPILTVRFRKQGEGDDHVVESEPLPVTVRSLLPDEADDLTIKEIVPPMALPAAPRPWLYGLLGLVGLLGLGGGVLWFRRRRQRPEKTAPIIPPHQAAYDALQRLLAENLVDHGAIKPFYLGLSTILRHYIEDRFGLRAPERTTEEFLLDLRRTEILRTAHKQLLTDFLRHCDMVKFAEHTPTSDEIQTTFDSCKRFIMETEPQAQEGEVS